MPVLTEDKLHCRAVYVGAKEMDGQKVYTFRATTDVVDRQGEIVTLDGWEFGNYDRNPVILDSHQYDGIEHIVGRAAGPLRNADGGWEVDVLFAEDTPRGKLAKTLTDGGFLKAVSVGFRSLERARGQSNEPLKHTRKELLEISVVPVPANPEALRLRGLADTVTVGKLMDFSSTLAEAKRRQDLWERRWELESALCRVIGEALEDAETEADAKVALIDLSLAQYHMAMVGWFRTALAAGIKSGTDAETKDLTTAIAALKAGRRLSAKTEAALSECADHMQAALSGIQSLMSPPEDMPDDGDMPPEDMQEGKSADPASGSAADTEREPVLAVDAATLEGLKAFVGQNVEE